MKNIILILVALYLAACAKPGESIDPKVHQQSGGVDVGNYTGLVPETNASISYPSSWSSTSSKDSLLVSNQSGSSISLGKSDITDLSSPTALALQQYLKAKYPERNYQIVNVNGLEGVRSELVNTTAQKSSDLYLVSELKDFIHIRSDLKATANGIAEGEKIILTVRVKYRGVAYIPVAPKSVTLEPRSKAGSGDHHAYSFMTDCFTYADCKNGQGVAVAFENGFSIGTAGADHGRIIDLGNEREIPFESLKIDGDSLTAPLTNIPLADIYTAFTPNDPKKDQNSIELLQGHTYLVRTISWPEEDVITKMFVEKLDGSQSLTIRYQKLVYVPQAELQKQVDENNAYTRKFEQPLFEGEMVLYTRSEWDNYFYSSFNFEYSTSGNYDITRNSWDLMLDRSRHNTHSLSVMIPRTGSAVAKLTDVGVRPLSTVSLNDFSSVNDVDFGKDYDLDLSVGHTYLIDHYRFDDGATAHVQGAVQVVDIDKEGKWARFKFRRISMAPADHFQKWIPLSVPTQIVRTKLEVSKSWLTARFLPFVAQRSDQANHYYEHFDYDARTQTLETDPRPFGPERGFTKMPTTATLESVTDRDIANLSGKLNRSVQLKKGDLLSANFENYFDKTVVVMRVDELTATSVSLSIRYLSRAKAQYSDDKN